MDLALNNQQRLIFHKTQQTKLNQTCLSHLNNYSEECLYSFNIALSKENGVCDSILPWISIDQVKMCQIL